MLESVQNPFNITKSVDFTDQEINDYWVDISGGDGFVKLIKPTSNMPMFVLGGKGSGKTHIMRYFSYSLQKIRHKKNIVEGIKKDGYLGVYLRCSGLNSPRFRGKGIEDDIWEDVFVYYMELWLAQLILENITDAFQQSDELKTYEKDICDNIIELFDAIDRSSFESINDIISYIRNHQRELDYAINNCAIKRKIDIKICVTRGKFIFGIPKMFSNFLPSLSNCLFLYLIDEFENMSESQQKYINTIIREKEGPCSFKIGSRLYGIKTWKTFSGGETNKVGSEFEIFHLDDILRKNGEYKNYAKRLIANRFAECRYPSNNGKASTAFCENLDSQFEEILYTEYAEEETKFILEKYQSKERPYFKSLHKKLKLGFQKKIANGIESEGDINYIIECLRYDEIPLIEKVNILIFYQRWSTYKENLIEVASEIKADCSRFIEDKNNSTKHKTVMEHFKSDLIAQLLRECGRGKEYTGLNTFIEMSWGLPRNLLVLLKNIFAWAIFYGEKPFSDKKISIKAQNDGVIEASNWFYSDARIEGKYGKRVRDCLDKLGNFYREIRFSDKPSECNCVSFSADLTKATEETSKMIEILKNYSLIIEVGKHSDKNTGRVFSKYQINRMLAPRWDLSMYRRGTIIINSHELNALFDIKEDDSPLRERTDGMMAPQFRKSINDNDKQIGLPGLKID